MNTQSAFCGSVATHVVRRDDAVILDGREYVPTVYGEKGGNTIWVDSVEKLREVGGEIIINEDQTEIWLTLPKGHKFSIQMFRPTWTLGIVREHT